MKYIREGEGPNDEDMILYGRYECPKCGHAGEMPEYLIGLQSPACAQCWMDGTVVMMKLKATAWRCDDDQD
jgi:hypothetical protein